MKKCIAWLLAMLMVFSLAACGGSDGSQMPVGSEPAPDASTAEDVEDTQPDGDTSAEEAENAGPEETAETGEPLSLSGLNFVIPDYATYTVDEDPDTPSILIELEPGMRRAMIMTNNLGSFSEESTDLLNQMMVASFFDGMDVVSQDDYEISVAGEVAQVSICIVDDDGSRQSWAALAFMHDGTQYLCAYVEVASAEGDSTDFFNLLETMSFDA